MLVNLTSPFRYKTVIQEGRGPNEMRSYYHRDRGSYFHQLLPQRGPDTAVVVVVVDIVVVLLLPVPLVDDSIPVVGVVVDDDYE
jgi:hypothetical protein